MHNGLWLLPSLGRAQLLNGFFGAYYETESSTPGLILVDETDPKLEEYKNLKYPIGWELVITKAITMGDKVREIWPRIIDKDWVGILNDDHRPRTKHWDKQIISQINGTNVISTNDGPTPDKPWNAPNRLCGAICFSGGLLRALGYMFSEDMHHFYSDDVWGTLFGKSGCAQVMMGVCVEHVHAYKNPELRDETYKKINGEADPFSKEPKGGLWDADRAALLKWQAEKAQADLMKIIALQPKQGLMLGYLSHDNNVSADFAMGLMDTTLALAQHNIYFEVARIEGSSLISHARNQIVDMFLKSKCQRLLFVDSDQGFNRNHVFHLLGSNRPIVAGVTPHKRFPMNLNFEPLPEDIEFFKELTNKSAEEFFHFIKQKGDQKGEVEVNRAGTGFIMIDRSVFETTRDGLTSYLAFDDKNDTTHHEFFRMGEYQGRFRGEDWYFCQKAKEAKIPIFINSNALVMHQGNFKYSIDESKRQ